MVSGFADFTVFYPVFAQVQEFEWLNLALENTLLALTVYGIYRLSKLFYDHLNKQIEYERKEKEKAQLRLEETTGKLLALMIKLSDQ